MKSFDIKLGDILHRKWRRAKRGAQTFSKIISEGAEMASVAGAFWAGWSRGEIKSRKPEKCQSISPAFVRASNGDNGCCMARARTGGNGNRLKSAPQSLRVENSTTMLSNQWPSKKYFQNIVYFYGEAFSQMQKL